VSRSVFVANSKRANTEYCYEKCVLIWPVALGRAVHSLSRGRSATSLQVQAARVRL